MSNSEIIDTVAETIGDRARWWVGSGGSGGWISLNLFPTAENLVVKMDKGRIVAEISTTGSGPGFHQHVCKLLDDISDELGSDWEAAPGDDTGYYEDRNTEKLQRTFLDWLEDVGNAILGQKQTAHFDEGGSVRLCMDVHTQFQCDAPVLTNLGPRDLAWAESVARDSWLHRDFFPWWNEEPDAHDHLQKALLMLWSEQTWRQPEIDFESGLNHDIHQTLLRAEQDPSLVIPYREWLEILPWISDVSDADKARIKERASTAQGDLIGYRRNPIQQRFGLGWFANFPGSFRLDETNPEADYMIGPGVEIRVKVLTQFNPNLLQETDFEPGTEFGTIPITDGNGHTVVTPDGTAILFAQAGKTAIMASCCHLREGVNGDCLEWLVSFDHEPPAVN